MSPLIITLIIVGSSIIAVSTILADFKQQSPRDKAAKHQYKTLHKTLQQRYRIFRKTYRKEALQPITCDGKTVPQILRSIRHQLQYTKYQTYYLEELHLLRAIERDLDMLEEAVLDKSDLSV